MSAQNYQAFKEGEWLKYRLHYGFLNASYATIKLEKAEVKGKTVFRAIGKGKTTGFASLFFKVDDTYESFFELDSVRPVYFKRDIYEGGYTKHIEIDYDFDRSSAKIYNIKDSTSFSLDIHDKMQNGVFAVPFFQVYDNNLNANFGGYSSVAISSGNADANGYGNFEYAPPSGYYAICSKNLSEFG